LQNRSGSFKLNLSGEAAYYSFVPSKLPPDPPLVVDGETSNLLARATGRVALLDGLSARIPDPALFSSMQVRKEALLSSQIEGTQATLDDIFDPAVETNANQNVAEVVNHVRATDYAVQKLKELPLCNRLLRETHRILMEGRRGQEKTPGYFRTTQNWIGGHGSAIKNARYIPPSPDDMTEAINNLELYINEDEISNNINLLAKAALIHYQFETIHPFLDGNGRIGRLLLTLFLIEKKALSAPVLNVSFSLKRNRAEYYDRLMIVRERGDYEQWIRFFLLALIESADDAISAIDKLGALRDKNIGLLAEGGRETKTARALFEYVQANPIIGIKKTADALGVSFNTASEAVNKLRGLGILKQTGGARRNRLFAYEDYLEILRNGT